MCVCAPRAVRACRKVTLAETAAEPSVCPNLFRKCRGAARPVASGSANLWLPGSSCEECADLCRALVHLFQ